MGCSIPTFKHVTMPLHNLLSSFNMVTVASSLFVSRVTVSSDNDESSILNTKLSSLSNISSLLIVTSNEALVCPATNVTPYGPGL